MFTRQKELQTGFGVLNVTVHPLSRGMSSRTRAVCCCSAPTEGGSDGPIVVPGDLVVVPGFGNSSGARIAAVVAVWAGGKNATVAPVVRRRGASTEEVFVDFGADEYEPEKILNVVDADVSSRQMTVDNPHGEVVEDYWIVPDEVVEKLGASPLACLDW